MGQSSEPIPPEQSQQAASLWSSFVSSRHEEEYYSSWLALQSELIDGAVQSILVVRGDTKGSAQFSPVAAWPQGNNDPVILSDLLERVIDEECGLLLELNTEQHYAVGYPVMVDEQLHGVVALELAAAGEARLRDAMEQLQWGSSWLELLIRRKQNSEDQILLTRLKKAVDMLAVTLEKEQFITSAMAFTTELAAATGCERISMGFVRNNHMRLQAVSHSVEVGEKMNLTRTIERVMDEAVLQRSEVVYPVIDKDTMLISREHEALSRQQSMAGIATFPMFSNDRYYGALTCERGAENPFVLEDIEFIRAVLALAGPAMEGKFINDRSPAIKFWQGGKRFLGLVIGREHLGKKLIFTLLASLALFFSLAEGNYRVSADTVLEGAVQRAIVVPFDGYIDRASARAGDLVEKGQLLCSMDNRDLHLGKLAKHSKFRQLERQYQEAVAKHDRAQSGIIKAQLDQYQAELDLIDSKLERTNLLSPFSGLLVSGDLSQRLGSTVKQGEILFEVAPLDGYRVIVKVDERRIADIQMGQKGTLVLSSLPEKQYRFSVSKITPITISEEGRNYFRVEAHLEDIDENLRPGMEGVGKIGVDRRKLVAIWTREFVDWLKIKAWAWWP